MFEHNYKNAMDHITPDADIKDKILDQIILKEEIKARKNPVITWRIAFACVASVAIILGAVFIPRDTVKTHNNNASQTLSVTKSYDEIYDLIMEEYKKQNEFSLDDFIDSIGNIGKKKSNVKKKVNLRNDVFEEEIEYVTEYAVDTEGAMDGSSQTNTQNGTAMDDANKKEESEDFSTTTEQVEGVAEADIVKTDGKYIYYLLANQLTVFKADGENSVLLNKITIADNKYDTFGDMFLKDDRLILLQPNDYYNGSNFVSIIIYDVSDPENPKQLTVSRQEGGYNSSRMIGDYIYLISNCGINIDSVSKDDPTTFVPVTVCDDKTEAVTADSVHYYEQENYDNCYTVIGAFDCKDGTLSDSASLLGGTDQVYCSQGNIIATNHYYNTSEQSGTYSRLNNKVSRLEISEGQIEYKATGEINGGLENQFFIDEHNGYFRFVTTVTMATITTQKFDNSEVVVSYETDEQYAKLTVLDSDMKTVGELKDLAKGERVYSVRFMGDIVYFVTFRQTDPLFSADLSDPHNPKILGELKIPGFSEYMYPYGDGLLLGFGMDADEKTGITKDLKLSMFDISDPANVTEQDKTIVDGYNHSPALENHRSMLVSPSKNLIGFAAHANYNSVRYMIYEHIDGAFNRKAVLQLPYETVDEAYKYYDSIRGLFIGNNFYLVCDKGLQVFDINTFLQIKQVEI